jgi:hypothetical protein
MNVNGSASANGTPDRTAAERRPRRLVLLAGAEDSEAEKVLAEYRGAEVTGKRLHAELQRHAEEHPGRLVAAEWAGPLGWTRFLWCRRGDDASAMRR